MAKPDELRESIKRVSGQIQEGIEAPKMTKEQQIIEHLKDRAADQWPTNADLGQEFGCNAGTAKRAKDKLLAQIAKATPPVKGEIRSVPLTDLVLDKEIQMRPKEDKEATERYQTAYEQGETLPPLIAFEDPDTKALLLAAGFHRRLAAIAAGLVALDVEVRPGTKRDAILFAASDNATHGVPRDRETQRRSVEAVLALPGYKRKSTQFLADLCKVSWDLVDAIQKGYGSVSEKRAAEKAGEKRTKGDGTIEVERDGQTFEVQSEKLGRKKDVPTSEPEPEAVEVATGGAEPPAAVDAEAWLSSLPLAASSNIDQDAFRAQALAYRGLQTLLRVYRDAIEDEIPDAEVAYQGAFSETLRAPLSILHPRDWKLCPVCKGKGKTSKSGSCGCGGGFYVR